MASAHSFASRAPISSTWHVDLRPSYPKATQPHPAPEGEGITAVASEMRTDANVRGCTEMSHLALTCKAVKRERVHVCMCACVRVCVCACVRVCVCVDVYTCACKCSCVNVSMCVFALLHAHSLTHINTHTHTTSFPFLSTGTTYRHVVRGNVHGGCLTLPHIAPVFLQLLSSNATSQCNASEKETKECVVALALPCHVMTWWSCNVAITKS